MSPAADADRGVGGPKVRKGALARVARRLQFSGSAASSGVEDPVNHRWLSVLALAVVLGSPVGAQKVEIKLATQAPENSPWHKMLVDMNTEWQTLTGGDVSMAIYPGGVSGDESDILRKMRIGQLHAQWRHPTLAA